MAACMMAVTGSRLLTLEKRVERKLSRLVWAVEPRETPCEVMAEMAVCSCFSALASWVCTAGRTQHSEGMMRTQRQPLEKGVASLGTSQYRIHGTPAEGYPAMGKFASGHSQHSMLLNCAEGCIQCQCCRRL